MAKCEGIKKCEDLLNEKTIEILKTHKPKPLPEDLVKELKGVEKSWLERVGLKQYPERAKPSTMVKSVRGSDSK
jgi:hypothetical protein